MANGEIPQAKTFQLLARLQTDPAAEELFRQQVRTSQDPDLIVDNLIAGIGDYDLTRDQWKNIIRYENYHALKISRLLNDELLSMIKKGMC